LQNKKRTLFGEEEEDSGIGIFIDKRRKKKSTKKNLRSFPLQQCVYEGP